MNGIIMKSVNFEFLRDKWPELASLGGFAEQYAWQDPEIQALIAANQDAFDAIRAGVEMGNAMLTAKFCKYFLIIFQ